MADKMNAIVLSLDVMDESGDHVTDYDHDVFKVRLDADGNEIHREKATGKGHRGKENGLE